MFRSCCLLAFRWGCLFNLGLGLLSSARAQEVGEVYPVLQTPRGARGEKAIEALGTDLPRVARWHGKSAAELRALLRRDHSLRLDGRGQLHYGCEGLAVPEVELGVGAGELPQALAPLEQTFLLHSKPGANRTIFLDFDGHTLSGNAWTANYNGGTNIVAPAWDMDGTPGVFSTAELTAIQQIWLRVAEDFAGFEVDVTTEFPGEAALTRANNGDQVYGTRALVSAISSYFGNYGGIAYVGAFNDVGDYYKPALVFPERLSHSEKNIAEAISHEVGHNLGLSHDGTTTGAEYYTGQGNWAPIMGVGYSKPITQWSQGDYANANNPQDDLLVITQNGLAYRSDDHGNTLETARMLAGFNLATNGIIERNTDGDYFGFSTFGGAAVVTVTPWERGANLHLLVALYNSAGVLLTNREVADTTAGVQPVSLGLTLEAGTFYVRISGGGVGNPFTTGYTNYASLGNYTLALSLPPVGQWLPVAGGNYSWPTAANWVNGGVPNGVDAVANVNNDISGAQVVTVDAAVTVGRLELGDADGSHGFTLNDGGGTLVFDVASGAAQLVKSFGADDVLNVPVNLLADLVVSNASLAELSFNGGISGSQSLVKSGAGLVRLGGTNVYTGATIVAAGTLALAAAVDFAAGPLLDLQAGAQLDASALAGGLLLANGGQLGGRGAVTGDLTAGPAAYLFPGGSNEAGALTINGNLTLGGSAHLMLDLAADPQSPNASDVLTISGDLILNGSNRVVLNALEEGFQLGGSYPVITYGGALIGPVAGLAFSNSTRLSFTADDSVPGEVRVNVAGAPGSLVWRGNGTGNQWDLATTATWRQADAAETFLQLDHVTFDAAGSNNTFINLSGALTPGSVTVNATKNYVFGGTGKLTGAGSWQKQGLGMLTVSNANEFTGPVVIAGGTVRTAHPNALGASSGATWVTNAGVLDLYGRNLGAEPILIAGAGTGAGALLNSGGSQTNAIRFLTLTGDASIGGTGRWDVRANPTAAVVGNHFNLSKVGTGQIWLADVGEIDLGDVEIRAGVLGLAGNSTLNAGSNSVAGFSGTTWLVSNSVPLTMTRPLWQTNASWNAAGTNLTWAGPVRLQLSNTWTVAAQLSVPGDVAGGGSLRKAGAGTLILSGSNAFGGTLYVDSASGTLTEGAVRLSGPQAASGLTAPVSLRNTGNGVSTLQLEAGVSLPFGVMVSGRNHATAAIQNLSGSNHVAGGLFTQSGGAEYRFQSDAGILQLAGDLQYLGGLAPVRTYTFQGAGDFYLAGNVLAATNGTPLALAKTGAGKLVLLGTNQAWTAGAHIAAGTLQIGAGDLTGSIGFGAITNEGNLAFRTLRDLVVTNEISGRGALLVEAAGLITLPGENFYTGTTVIGAGEGAAVVRITHGHALGGASAGTTIGPGGNQSAARLEVLADITCSEPLALAGRAGTNLAPAILNVSGTNVLTGNITLLTGGSNYNFQSDAGKLVLAGNWGAGQGNGFRTNVLLGAGFGELTGSIGTSGIGGSGGEGSSSNLALLKLDSGTWSLSGSNLSAGPTIVAAGTLFINGVCGAGPVLATAGTLAGAGLIQGTVVIESGANLAPGAGIGTLSISNSVQLAPGANLIVEINRELGTYDQLFCSGSLQCAGRLVVTNLAGEFAVGDSFPLLGAGAYVGNFSEFEFPPLPVGQAWSFQPTNGVLRVISTMATTPPELSWTTMANGLAVSWPATHLGWLVQVQTNMLSFGLGSNWTTLPESAVTNYFVLPLDPAPGSVFLRLTLP